MSIILAIETSCDETSAAVVKNGSSTSLGTSQEILSCVVSTQVEFHKKYGGVVPEIASRKHIEVVNPVIQQALDKAKIKQKDLDAVAVTYGPGLIGALLVGVCAAKAIAYSLDIPLIGINHLEGHIYANFLEVSRDQGIKASSSLKPRNLETLIPFPFVCLMVSGGHTMLVLVEDHGKYKVLGRTRDDAAGEAFDKVARFLKLGYPGGPIIDKLAKEGNPKAIEFKRPMMEKHFGYDFSFSGIKTAVVNFVTQDSGHKTQDLVASFQQAVVDVLVDKTLRAAKEYNCKTICLAGGVAANSCLRSELQAKGKDFNIVIPPLSLCTDNAAMIGCAAYYKLKSGETSQLDLRPVANLSL